MSFSCAIFCCSPRHSSVSANDVLLSVKRKKKSSNLNVSQANAVAVLNDLQNGLKYDVVEQSGPAHAPIFKVSVIVNGQAFVGLGGSKKSAKCQAAELALKSFVQFPDNYQMLTSPKLEYDEKADFTSDLVLEAQPIQKCKSVDDKTKIMKRPAMFFNEMYPNAKYECVTNEADVYARFKVILTVDGKDFVGTGEANVFVFLMRSSGFRLERNFLFYSGTSNHFIKYLSLR